MATRKAKKKVTANTETSRKRGPAARREKKPARASAPSPGRARTAPERNASPAPQTGKAGRSKSAPKRPMARPPGGAKAAGAAKPVRKGASAKAAKRKMSAKPAARKAPSAKSADRKTLAREAVAAAPSRKRAASANASRPTPGKPAHDTRKADPSKVRRYDRPGHLDPKYAADLLRQSGPQDQDPHAFFETPRVRDDFAEERGEQFIEKVTTGEDEAEERLDQVVPEEQGGPFIETDAAQEFAHGTDASNPKGAKREPFPTT